MDAIEPIAITDSVLVDCNIVDEAAAYDATKEYKDGDVVSYGGVLYEDAVGVDCTNIGAFDLTKEYITDDQAKVAADNAVYKAIKGAIPYNFTAYAADALYVAGNYVKIVSTKGVYLAKTYGENPANYNEWNGATEYLSGSYVKVTPTYALKNGNIANQIRIYKALRGTASTDANLNKSPASNLTGSTPYWSFVGICNYNSPPDTSILYEEWDEDKAGGYALDAVVKVTSYGAAFVSLVADNTSEPQTNLIGSNPKWKRLESFDCNRTDANYLWELTDTLNIGIDPATNIKDAKNICWKKIGVYNIGMNPLLYPYVAATSDSDAVGTWHNNGPTNKYRMLDNVVDTYASRAESIEFSLVSAFYDTIAMFNVDALSCLLQLVDTSTGEVKYEEYISTITSAYSDWYDVFNVYPETDDSIIRSMPSFPNAKIVVVLSKPNGTVRIGHLSIGYSRHIGKALYPLEKTINDYSKVTTDEYGRTTFSRGAYAFKSDVKVYIPTGTESAIEKILANLRATPCVWRMDNHDIYDGTTPPICITYAKYNTFSIALERQGYSIANLELLSIA